MVQKDGWYSMGFFFNLDSRIHINLSNYAWNVINEDMFNFYRDDLDNISGFINDVIENFHENANCSIQLRCDEISNNFEELLTDESLKLNIDGSIFYSVINVATDSFKKKAINIINSYPKGTYRKIKLRKNTAIYLQECQEDIFFDGNVGYYIKALIEEYVRLPFNHRENIHCRYNMDLINKAQYSKKQLKIRVRSGKEFEAIPFKIETDKLGIFSYLVAIDVQSRKPVAYRISKCKMNIQSKSGKISKQEEDYLNKKLIETDVTFLTNDTTRVVLKLDKYGIQKYNSQLHLRPSYIEKLEDNRYVFDCSLDQIKYYFIKFGSSVIIEEPNELVDYFRKFYTYALRNYQIDR